MESTYKYDIVLGASKPTSVPTEQINVKVGCTPLMEDYARAFVSEAARKNPLTFNKVELTEQEMLDYVKFLLFKRIECVQNKCADFRLLKVLYIPGYVQYILSQIGECLNRNQGIKLVPVYGDDPKKVIKYADAVKISDKIRAFEDDLQMVKDAMPRSIDGDLDVMSCALIADYIRAEHEVEHVRSTYVAAFAGFKLEEELAFKVLYRKQYDDIEFVTKALLQEKIF
jgi:hypothetical protein